MATESIVNELTGEASTPEELLAQLRSVERSISRLDDTIFTFAAELRAAKQAREKAVAELRSIVREVKVREQLAAAGRVVVTARLGRLRKRPSKK